MKATKLTDAGIEVRVDSIVTPPNFDALMGEPRIAALADNLREVSQIAAVVLREKADGKRYLVAGHDRLAAAKRAGMVAIRADIRTGSDAAFLLLQIAENAARRHGDNAALWRQYEAARIGELTQREGGTKVENVPPTQRVKGQVRKEIAAAEGVTRGAVRKREQRARIERHDDEPEVDHVAEMTRVSASEALELPLGFETFGVTLPPERRAEILLAIDDLDGWRRVIAGVEEQLRQRLQAADPVVPHAVTEAIRAKLEGVLVALGTAKPVALCSKCRGQRCERCRKTGVVAMGGNAALSALTPPPLKGERKVTVVVETTKEVA